MKSKSILIAALAFLISCETSNVDNIYTSTEEVSFAISQDNNYTKGTPIGNALGISDIGVFATLTQEPYAEAENQEPQFMFNKLVERDGNKWVYNPPQKWSSEPDDLISFFAYAPYANSDNGITIVEESNKMPTIRYQLPQTNTLQPDLMVAIPVYNRVKDQGAVGLTLRHALAAISFSVKGDPTRKITSVRLNNVVGAATLSLESSDIAWSDHEDRSTQSYDLGIADSDTAPTNGDVSTSITASDGYLMMIPQDITSVKIEVQVEGETELRDFNFESGSVWVAGAQYDYIIDLETESISYDISQTSNCYIVSNTDITEIYIPIDQRINAFWHDYSGLSESEAAAYMIDSDTEWNAEVVWCDNNDLSVDDVTTVDRYTGIIPDDSDTSKSYVCDGTKAVMKVTLPDNAAIGNILITVKKMINYEMTTLWSWHLWVTDYDPDSAIVATKDPVKYKVTNGKLHRYINDSEFWTTGLYANTYIMDRDLGSHDNESTNGLFYQWGRKDPFSVKGGWRDKGKPTTFATAVQNPNIFYAHERGWCNEPIKDASDYLWYDTKLLNCDANAFKKSIFDPSPLGWCVPLKETYGDWTKFDNYGNTVLFSLGGDIHPSLGDYQSERISTKLWSSDKSTSGGAYCTYVKTTSITLEDVESSFGCNIRPVKIPN